MSTFREDAAVYGGLLSTIDSNVKQFATAMSTAKSQLASATSGVAAVQSTATATTDLPLGVVVNKVSAQVASDFTSEFGGINVLAQFPADISEAAGLEGSNNELRVYKNGVKVAVSQDS